MMTAQGWQPGQFLGAKDAKHAEFHTAANASHIRVAIKDDNLGLGAKVGSGVGHGECTGLDVFKNILGRLNGKDELEIEKERQSREDLKRAIYTERKWGSIRFVQGGFLIGDKIQLLIDGEVERIRRLADGTSSGSSSSSSSSESDDEDAKPVAEIKKSKKRKADVLAEPVAEIVGVKVKKSKKSKKSEVAVEEVTAILQEVKLPKKSKKDRRQQEDIELLEEKAEDSAAAQRKREKKERKRKREERRKEKAGNLDIEENLKSSKKSKREKKKAEKETGQLSESSQPTTKINTPSVPLTAPSSGRSTPLMHGRHAVRSRNIAQKRLAAMDATALNQVLTPSSYFRNIITNLSQIFMIKS
jgi:Pin2-interacting protein X1